MSVRVAMIVMVVIVVMTVLVGLLVLEQMLVLVRMSVVVSGGVVVVDPNHVGVGMAVDERSVAMLVGVGGGVALGVRVADGWHRDQGSWGAVPVHSYSVVRRQRSWVLAMPITAQLSTTGITPTR